MNGNVIKPSRQFGTELLQPEQIKTINSEIYILDRGDESIKVYSMDGAFKTKFSGKGEGPGENMFATTFFVDKDKIYILDPFRKNQVNIFSAKNKKFLFYKRTPSMFQGYGPLFFATSNDGTFFCSNYTLLKGQRVIVKLDKDLRPINAFLDCIPMYETEKDYFKAKDSGIKPFMNNGYVAVQGTSVYFAYFLLDKVFKFSSDGKLLKEYKLPLPSIDKKVKLHVWQDGSSDLERRLNYGIKVVDNKVFIMSRNDSGQSILYELKSEQFVEIARMNEMLLAFEIVGNRLYGIHDGEEGAYIYDLKGNLQ